MGDHDAMGGSISESKPGAQERRTEGKEGRRQGRSERREREQRKREGGERTFSLPVMNAFWPFSFPCEMAMKSSSKRWGSRDVSSPKSISNGMIANSPSERRRAEVME